jgi:rRNA maturation endonuclease Nob1
MKEENEKVRRRCPVCDTELNESEDTCPKCGCYVEEPAYDIEDDLEDEE